MSNFRRTELDSARDELMSHIQRCQVTRASREQQQEWMDDTMSYMVECFPKLTPEELDELHAIGMRFCQPVIPYGKEHSALTLPEVEEEALAGAV